MGTPTEETALARRWRLQINMAYPDDLVTPDWVTVIGIAEFTPPAPQPNNEDSSDYESAGWNGNTKTAQEWELPVTLNRKINDVVKVFHPTHEKLRQAAWKFGSKSKAHLRWFDRDGLPEAYEGKGIVQWEYSGGEHTALEQVTVTITGDGELLLIDNPGV
ncbi:phage tail tube protein [Streptomyces sp. NPDC057620]|uniref:phage tail tube protein n=1 Tax=Streptomyces sp. NPDC057620 TaxID=3346185 RepID=UPI00368F2C0B